MFAAMLFGTVALLVFGGCVAWLHWEETPQ